MKKNRIYGLMEKIGLFKMIKIMRFTIFILFLSLSQTFAVNSYSQQTKLSLDMRNARVEDVIDKIEKNSEFFFMYNKNMIDVDRKVDIQVEEKSVNEVLDKIFANSGITYSIKDRQILLINTLLQSEINASNTQQQKNITGKVIDSSGAPLPGVSVVIKGTTNGVITDANGKFSLTKVHEDATLQFSFVGMKPQEVKVAGKTTVSVTLIEETIGIDEVVAIGYGTMKKSDLTGAIVSVNSESLEKSVAGTFDQALQGRAAGVQVMANSGQPGAATTVRIRGTNSLLGTNEPLYVIDGIQIGGTNEGVLWVGNGGNPSTYTTSPLSTLNPSDIESIEILKDASATAIYGNKGANGVVIVTTKKGSKGGAKISYEYNQGIKTVAHKIGVLGLQDYARLNNEKSIVAGKTPRFDNPEALSGGTNWQDAIFNTGQIQNHNLSFSGGTDKTTYYVSGGYNFDSGPVVNSWMERYSLRANVEVKMKPWLNFGNNFNVGRSNTKYIMADSSDSPLMLSLIKAPDIPVYDENGNYVGMSTGQELGGGVIQANPVALTEHRDSRKMKFDVFNSSFFDFIYKNFTLKTEINIAGNFAHDYAFYARTEYPGFINSQSQLRERMSFTLSYTLKNILNYKNTFGDHSVNAMIAHEARGGKYNNIFGAGGAFYNNNLNSLSLSNSGYIATGGGRNQWSSESYLARCFYSYKDIAMLTTSIRADGSPNFPKENRWGYFPSISGAIKISNLGFFQNYITFINKLKLNGGYGVVGSDNVLGGFYSPYVSVQPTTDGSFSTSFLNYDSNLRWESTRSTNLGLELGMFKNRINLQLEFYKKKTTDALNQVLLPSSVGSGIYVVSNIASVQNKGIELTLNTINTNGEFSWKTDFTLTVNRNKILSLGKNGLPLYGSSQGINYSKNVEGGPIGRFWGYKAEGLYQNFDDIATSARWTGISTIDPNSGLWIGDHKFADISDTGRATWNIPGYTGQYDKNGVYIPGTAVFTGNSKDNLIVKDAPIINTDDQTFIGDPNPDFTFGMSNNFKFKNFDLTIYLVGTYGNDVYNNTKARLLDNGINQNSLTIAKEHAVPTLREGGNAANIFDYSLKNPNAEVGRLRNGTNFAQTSTNSRFIEDGSYIRLQNVVFGYNLPKRLISKYDLTNVRLYMNAQNLFTFSKYTGWDPEVGSFAQSSLSAGIDNGRYPVARIIMLGVQLGF